jgi:hypothetical protein
MCVRNNHPGELFDYHSRIYIFESLLVGNNSCQYLAELWLANDAATTVVTTGPNNSSSSSSATPSPPSSSSTSSTLLNDYCICLCDDDNDIEMAVACRHAFLPSVASDRMRRTVQTHASHCTVANGADEALRLALDFIRTGTTTTAATASSDGRNEEEVEEE